MRKNLRHHLQTLSHLIDYPDGELRAAALEAEGELTALGPERGQADLRPFFTFIRKTGLVHIQAAYTAAFDLNPQTALFMAGHLIPDQRQRGMLLARLAGLYAQAGFEAAPGHTPDYLPLMLEFMAVAPEDDALRLMGDCLPGVETLARRLEAAQHPYAPLFGQIAGLLQAAVHPARKDAL